MHGQHEPRLQFLHVSQQSPHWCIRSPDKTIVVLRSIAEASVNPKGAIKAHAKRKAAGKLAKSPYLSRRADLEFLKPMRSWGANSSSDDEKNVAKKIGNIDQCEETIAQLEKRGQSTRVAWVTARHMQKVRVVDAIPPLPFPDDSFLRE